MEANQPVWATNLDELARYPVKVAQVAGQKHDFSHGVTIWVEAP
jgi:hypothetical protein